MIFEKGEIRGISNSNPVQFWPYDKPTFNERVWGRVAKKKYNQKFLFSAEEYNRLDVLFNTARFPDYDSGTTYNIGDTVYDPVNKVRWVSKVDDNTGNDPVLDLAFEFWDHSPMAVATPLYDGNTTYNNGDRVIAPSIVEGFSNPDFAGNIAGWSNFAYPGSFPENWTYDAGSGDAQASGTATLFTRGLKQAINSPSNHYEFHVMGSITCDDYVGMGSAPVFYIALLDASNVLIGTIDPIYSPTGNSFFDVSFTRDVANVASACIVVANDGVSVTFVARISLFSCKIASGPYKIYQSLTDANTGNDPETDTDNWEQVQEANGRYQLKLAIATKLPEYEDSKSYSTGNQVVYLYSDYESLDNANVGNVPSEPTSAFWNPLTANTINFENAAPSNKHQVVNFLWSAFAQLEEKLVRLFIIDEQYQEALAKSDCLDVATEFENCIALLYSNSDNFNGINYESGNPTFAILLPAVFYKQVMPIEKEDYLTSVGAIVQLRRQMMVKRLLEIIGYLPDYMHEKIITILIHDSLFIDGVPWKMASDDAYDKKESETSSLTRAEVMLTKQDSVLVNISKYDPLTAGKVFSGEFSEPFA